MKKQLEKYFGCTVNVNEYMEKLNLPIYMTMRHIDIVDIFGISFALVDITKETDLSVVAMKKQQKKYEEIMQCSVAYRIVFDSQASRNALVKNGVAFIELPGNVFLPFLGIVLQDVYKQQFVKSDKMMPATQMVFLELLYMEDNECVLKSEVARKLNLTKTSLTRATEQLREMNLIMENKSGKEITIARHSQRKEYYDRAKEFLINPVQKVITVKRDEMLRPNVQAGESALSSTTLLNPPHIEEKAIFKGAEIIDQLEIVDARFVKPSKCVKLQLWKYDPSYFEKNGEVDPVSLACTFKGNEDERIEMCIEELLEGI